MEILLAFVAGIGVASGVVVAVRRRRPRLPGALPTGRIDPFAVGEPWRHSVRAALQAQARFRSALAGVPAGPLRERLDDIGRRIDRGVTETWAIARRGDDLEDALDRLRPGRARARLAEADPADPTASALEAQVSSADRLAATAADAQERLRVLEARLDEAVARTTELAVTAVPGSDTTALGDTIDGVVDELEALRAALEELA
jgi:hypothetical protein